MSYSFGVVVENADYETIYDAARVKFDEVYPEADPVVSKVVSRIVDELPYLAEAFAGGTRLPDDHVLTIGVSGHEQIYDKDTAPRFVSVQVTLNKKPEEAESEPVEDGERVPAGQAA